MGARAVRWYLAGEQSLSQAAPIADTGADTYQVDFEATSGDHNRWWELSGVQRQTVYYAGRAEAARHLLSYLTPPLAEDTEITGWPVVTLYVTSSESDGAFIVYLEDVDPSGHVTYVTEGELRGLHRKVSTDAHLYKLQIPYHSFKRKDARPLIPGQVAELSFGLLPTSVLIRKGHRIRIGIAGHDKGTFPRIPASGAPVLSISRNRLHASYIDLPVIRR